MKPNTNIKFTKVWLQMRSKEVKKDSITHGGWEVRRDGQTCVFYTESNIKLYISAETNTNIDLSFWKTRTVSVLKLLLKFLFKLLFFRTIKIIVYLCLSCAHLQWDAEVPICKILHSYLKYHGKVVGSHTMQGHLWASMRQFLTLVYFSDYRE